MTPRRERRPPRPNRQDGRPREPRPRQGFLWALALIVIIGATYANSLSGPFIFDDFASIRDNPSIHSLLPLTDVLRPPSRGESVSGRPVVNLTLAINFALGGEDVRGYHIWNLATHIACALLLFGIVRRLLIAQPISATLVRAADGLAFASALVWAIHPLQSEAVDYIVARTESTMALFYLLTVYGAVRAAEGSHERAWTAVSVFACALGMASKESIVTAPLMVAMIDRVLLFGSWRDVISRRRTLYTGLAASWVVLAALLAGAPRAHSAGLVDADLGPGLETGVWTYLLNQAVMILRYLRLVVWPVGLVLDYGPVRPLALADVWWQFALVALLFIASVIALFIRPWLGLLTLWVFITLAPSSSIVPVVTEVGAERRMYLPAMALAVAFVLGTRAAFERLRNRRGVREEQWPRAGAVATLTLVLCTLTWQRTEEYASRTAIWQTVVDRWPHGRARSNLASMLYAEGRRDEAIDQLRAATADNPDAYFDLGAQLFVRGEHDAAISALQSFLQVRARHARAVQARDLIGQALVAQGKLDAAGEQFRALAADYPAYANALGRLGDVLLTQRRFEEAVPVLETFTSREPGNSVAWRNLGVARANAGRLDRAQEAFSRAVQLAPDDGDAQRSLAYALFEGQRFADAEPHAREAVRLKPRDPATHDLLGMIVGSLGRRDEAVGHFKAALTIDPGYEEAGRHMEIVQGARD